MIRNVVLGTLKPGVTPDEIEVALDALRAMRIPGSDFTLIAGQDLGLREGNASFAITVDFVDEEAYRLYDVDEEHNRIRHDMIAPLSASVTRIQFTLPQ
jgi:hypothetical protein